MRDMGKKAIPHNYTIMSFINNVIGIIPICVLAYYTNMVYPVLDIIEEAKADKEHFYWMKKVIGRDLVTNLILIAGWSWYVDFFQGKRLRQVKFL